MAKSVGTRPEGSWPPAPRKIRDMTSSAKTSAQVIIEEVRRQVDLQVSAAEGLDTKAMAIFAGVAAVAALIAPRVAVGNCVQGLVAIATFLALIGALICLLLAVRPRIGGFSNGPGVDQVAERIDFATDALERDLVPAFVAVRKLNEDFLRAKGDWVIRALGLLLLAVVCIMVMVGVGALT